MMLVNDKEAAVSGQHLWQLWVAACDDFLHFFNNCHRVRPRVELVVGAGRGRAGQTAMEVRPGVRV